MPKPNVLPIARKLMRWRPDVDVQDFARLRVTSIAAASATQTFKELSLLERPSWMARKLAFVTRRDGCDYSLEQLMQNTRWLKKRKLKAYDIFGYAYHYRETCSHFDGWAEYLRLPVSWRLSHEEAPASA
ncbi:unnamed protein product [Symbiodinium natans]|uniref:Uncharacterized protein n=1 Tax=Symbiodinium natans TaxID=878477 RepID=A0A812IAL1_9DINO|nr:unnamed protein product [Symbiodinium natans]